VINGILKNWMKKHITKNYYLLHDNPSGYIFFSKTPKIDISSTKIRYFLKNKFPCSHLLPIPVINYIRKHHLYN